MNVPLSLPDIGDLEIQYVTDVLRSGNLSIGPRVREFEDKFASFVGTRFAVATNSGTSALHLIVRALELGPEDEVITTSFSFFASAACILYERALPIFVDIDPLTLNIDPVQIRSFLEERCFKEPATETYVDRLTKRKVKAILPVHVFGLPCEMEPIMALAAEYRLAVIEDACEALGAKYQFRHVGTFGAAAAFAFYPNKQLTTAEGGMVVTNDEQIALLARSMRNQGRDLDSGWLKHVRLGYNFRLSDVHCAIGIAQLERLPELMDLRSHVANQYDQSLAGIPGLRLPYTPPWCDRSWFAYVARFDNYSGPGTPSRRNRIMQALKAKNIGCQPYFPSIHQQPYFREIGSCEYGRLANTDRAADSCLALPMFSKASSDQISYVCECLRDILKRERAELICRDWVTS